MVTVRTKGPLALPKKVQKESKTTEILISIRIIQTDKYRKILSLD